MVTSLAFHALVLLLLLLVPAKMLLPKRASKSEVDVVFYRAPKIAVPTPVVQPVAREKSSAGAPAPAIHPKPNAPEGPDRPVAPEIAPAPDALQQQHEKVGKAGILAFKEQLASLAQDKIAPRLGADARYGAADDEGHSSSPSLLTTSTPGGSGGINVASLNRSVGGGGGGGGGGGSGRGGVGGVQVGRATSPIASIGGGTDRPKARSGPGAARTDEEIQIVFDRYKAAFYRLYNRELRNNPTLKGQMVLRLTIEPDGSVSMCVLKSSDMDAPDLAAQVVDRVKTINFGAKENVPAVTIVYPIDFLPAG
ncbi:MAG TPA: AgmX/PglI C-terminal domain-containing protein [Terriglobales bacterium]